ncbi:MAG: HD domain-containing protein [Deltaproteobacteria bacterium]|nr:HD domain-containing protein [Deltaproteobacteria bacterium]
MQQTITTYSGRLGVGPFRQFSPQGNRTLAHYVSALAIMAFYGGRVCPFIEGLSLGELMIPLLTAFSLQFLLRQPLQNLLVENAPLELRASRIFFLELALFVSSGLSLGAFNMFFFGFPLESGAKLLVGMTTLGLFSAMDHHLLEERWLASRFRATGETLDPDRNFTSQPRRLLAMAVLLTVLTGVVFFLLVNKDLEWIVSSGPELDLAMARRSILLEVLFVAGVLFWHLFNLIRSYAANLELFFTREGEALEKAARGDFSTLVPVASSDEFGRMALFTNRMITGLREHTEEIRRTRDATIYSLASLAEARDNETGAHIIRTQEYVRALANRLKEHPDFSEALDPDTIEMLYKSAPLHDIGKVGIPDHILLKPGKLTPEEFEIMKGHPGIGAEALEKASAELGENSFLRFAREISLSHHEKWDGSGYPGGLRGDRIPLSGRLMAVADVYDALISKRVYKKAFTHQEASSFIQSQSGSHFDPRVVEAFKEIEQEIRRIATEHADKAH